MATRLRIEKVTSYRPDDNALTYRPDQDGRNAVGERIQFVPLHLIHPSPYQTRLVRDPEADRQLAEDVEASGFVHPPVVRLHPTIAGAYETVAGHRRVHVARLLAGEGRGARILRGDSGDADARCLGVIIRRMDDIEASERTIVENQLRSDLRAWEEARAFLRHKTLLASTGAPSSRRAVAATLDRSLSTLSPYLRVAERLTPEVRAMAADVSMFPGLEPVPTDDAAMCELTLQALQRASRGKTVEARAQALRRELSAVLNVEQPGPKPASAAPSAEPAASRGFQINIRRPLKTLSREQSGRYLERLTETSLDLFEQAKGGKIIVRESADGARLILVPALNGLAEEEAGVLAATLESILARLTRDSRG